MRRFFRETVWLLGFALLGLSSVCTKVAKGQGFPVIVVDTAVKNRLAVEWDADNKYQSERGYCVWFTVRHHLSMQGPLTVYRITNIVRAREEGASPIGIEKATCPDGTAFLHTHPPAECARDGDCELHTSYSDQCFPSPTDVRKLNRGPMPFALTQCDRWAIVPVWRSEPVPSVPDPEKSK